MIRVGGANVHAHICRNSGDYEAPNVYESREVSLNVPSFLKHAMFMVHHTHLHQAAAKGRLQLLQLLLSNGGDPSTRTLAWTPTMDYYRSARSQTPTTCTSPKMVMERQVKRCEDDHATFVMAPSRASNNNDSSGRKDGDQENKRVETKTIATKEDESTKKWDANLRPYMITPRDCWHILYQESVQDRMARKTNMNSDEIPHDHWKIIQKSVANERRHVTSDETFTANAPIPSGYTPLHWCCFNSRWTTSLEVARLLLTAKADVNAITDGGVDWSNGNETPLSMAARLGRNHLVRLFLAAGAARDTHRSDGRVALNPLTEAVANNQVHTVELLLRLGYSLGSVGQTALHTAVQFRALDVVNMLLSTCRFPRIPLNASDQYGRLPMHYIAFTDGWQGKTQRSSNGQHRPLQTNGMMLCRPHTCLIITALASISGCLARKSLTMVSNGTVE
jgi:hypothetical protein